MKNQGNMTPPKLNNSTVKNTNDSELYEFWGKEFKRMTRVINDLGHTLREEHIWEERG
jgi:hypothetical protein